jgi:putative ABC transport system substrate-binding protein
MMRRRNFITLLGGAAAAWPLAARGQQRAVPVVGFFSTSSPELAKNFVSAFQQGLGDAGFVDGRNVTIEYRWAHSDYLRLPELAADLVRRRVAVIVTAPRAQDAAKAATETIPIVFVIGRDPVRAGLVASLNRPGGNLTGIALLTPEMLAKRFGLLHDVVPQAAVIGVLLDSGSPNESFQLQEVQTAANSVGRTIRVVSAGSENEIDAAFVTFARERVDALITAASAYFSTLRGRIVELAARHRIPVIYELRDWVEAGGLMSYGPSGTDAYRQAGVYTGRILKGEKPADLPVMIPTKFEFVINLKTAKALGLAVPPSLLAVADEVIE